MSGISRAAWALLALLLLAVAGLTHGITVLALPWHSAQDAFTRVAAIAPLGSRIVLPDPTADQDGTPFRDPALITAVCRFDLRAKPFRLGIAPFESGFVTIGFHSRHGLAFYGLTVRATDATRLDLVLGSPDQERDPKPDGTDAPAHSVAVNAPEPEGFVMIATPSTATEDRIDAEERLARFDCGSAATGNP